MASTEAPSAHDRQPSPHLGHWRRTACSSVVDSKPFQGLVVLCVLLNCITLAINGPALNISASNALRILDYVFLGVFTVEMLLKWVANGLFRGPDAYFRDGECKCELYDLLQLKMHATNGWHWHAVVSNYRSPSNPTYWR